MVRVNRCVVRMGIEVVVAMMRVPRGVLSRQQAQFGRARRAVGRARHRRRHRAPEGQQHGQQNHEPDAQQLHRQESTGGKGINVWRTALAIVDLVPVARSSGFEAASQEHGDEIT